MESQTSNNETPRGIANVASCSDCSEMMKHPVMRELVLPRVFDILKTDGLEECRLVCKEWYEISKQCAVSLHVYRQSDLEEYVRRYPTMSALTLGAGQDSALDVRVRRFFMDRKPSVSMRTLSMPSFTEFPTFAKNLQGLTLHLYNNRKSFTLWDDFLSSLKGLRSLRLSISRSEDQNSLFQFDCLSHLTNLTSLYVNFSYLQCTQEQPVTQLSRLEELEIDRLCLRIGEELAFPYLPALSKLTLLHLEYLPEFAGIEELPALNLALPYAATLKELTVKEYLSFCSEGQCAQVMSKFSRLNSLSLELFCEDEEVFSEEIPFLTNLTHLHLVFMSGLPLCVSEQLTKLSNLRSLSLWCSSHHGILDSIDLRCFPNLTQLSMHKVAKRYSSLAVLTELKSLTLNLIRNRHDHDNFYNFEQLAQLALLEDLSISVCDGHLSKDVLKQLTKLKSIDLQCATIHDELIHHLEHLTGLTQLHLTLEKLRQDQSLAPLGNCSSLERLKLRVEQGLDQLSLFAEGAFLKLKYLSLPQTVKSMDPLDEKLRKRLPALRKLIA